MIRPRTVVLLALAALVLLAAGLAIRLALLPFPGANRPAPKPLARLIEPPPAGRVPAPAKAGTLRVPCWGCSPTADGWPVRFRTDLDLLAPLGDGPGNVAQWLKDFDRQVGARAAESEAAAKRRVDGPGDWGRILPPSDPLLAEAEPWTNQATMRFHPDVFPMEGGETRIPNLLLCITLGRSWGARASASPDAPSALEDGRRAVRFGRLLQQDDVTVIQDLVGLACIRFGAQALFDVAVHRGDHDLALAAAIVLGEHTAQRLRTAQLITRISVWQDPSRDMSDAKVETIATEARTGKDRRFRLEAIQQLALVRALAPSRGVRAAEKTLDEISRDPDALVAAAARWSRNIDLETLALETYSGSPELEPIGDRILRRVALRVPMLRRLLPGT
ncbi:MAG: hypothetical protein ACHQPI_06870 [Thermoanaerobaculia bacterium]